MPEYEASDLLRESRGESLKVYGVWDHDLESDVLIGLYARREDAERKAAEGGEYRDTPLWDVEEHEVLPEYTPPDPGPSREDLRSLGRAPLPYERSEDVQG